MSTQNIGGKFQPHDCQPKSRKGINPKPIIDKEEKIKTKFTFKPLDIITMKI